MSGLQKCFIRYLLYIYLFLNASDFDKFTSRQMLYRYLKIMSVIVLRFRNLCLAYTGKLEFYSTIRSAREKEIFKERN